MGKHIDKLPYDAPAGTRTLPVLLGQRRAKRLTSAMMVTYYLGIAALVAVQAIGWPALLTLGAVPLLVSSLRAYARPAPAEPPEDYPVWPLWWAPIAFVHTRRAGGLLLLGLFAWGLWTALR
jgi:1,4-dihydroxy-2-naphthoate octaprenyltransferase